MNVTAPIVVPDASEAAAWCARDFGAGERMRVPPPDGAVMTVELRIGESAVHVASESPDAGILAPHSIGATVTVLQITTDDADALWTRALAAGAEVRHDIADQFWGERHRQLTDPYGHGWNIAQHLRDVPRDQIVAAAATVFGRWPA
jgi:PhnB protein